MKPIFFLLLFFSCTAALLQGMEEDRKPASDSDSPQESLKEGWKQERYNSEKKAAALAGDTAESYSDDDAFIESRAPMRASNLEDLKAFSKANPKAARFILIEDKEGFLFLQTAKAQEAYNQNEEAENRAVIDVLRKMLLHQHPHLNTKGLLGEVVLAGKISLSSKMLQSIFKKLDSMSDRISSSSSSSAARTSPNSNFFDFLKDSDWSDIEKEGSRATSPESFDGHHVEKVAERGPKRKKKLGLLELMSKGEKATSTENSSAHRFKQNLLQLPPMDASEIPWDLEEEEIFSSQHNQRDSMSDHIFDSDLFKGTHWSDSEKKGSRAAPPGAFDPHHVEKVAERGTKRKRNLEPTDLMVPDEKSTGRENSRTWKLEQRSSKLPPMDASEIPCDLKQEGKKPYKNSLFKKHYDTSWQKGKTAALLAATKTAEEHYQNLLRNNGINENTNKELVKKIYETLAHCTWAKDQKLEKITLEKEIFSIVASIRAEALYQELLQQPQLHQKIETQLFISICSIFKDLLGNRYSQELRQAAEIRNEILDKHEKRKATAGASAANFSHRSTSSSESSRASLGAEHISTTSAPVRDVLKENSSASSAVSSPSSSGAFDSMIESDSM